MKIMKVDTLESLLSIFRKENISGVIFSLLILEFVRPLIKGIKEKITIDSNIAAIIEPAQTERNRILWNLLK